MPFKDQEKQREAQRRSMAKARVSPTGESAPKCETLDVKPEMSHEELKESLQWGIDTGRIRARDDVASTYNLTQPEPRYGLAQLTKMELLTLLNNDIKAKKIDAPLYFLGGSVPTGRYGYSKDWYK